MVKNLEGETVLAELPALLAPRVVNGVSCVIRGGFRAGELKHVNVARFRRRRQPRRI